MKMVDTITEAMKRATPYWEVVGHTEAELRTISLAVLEAIRKPTTHMCNAACKSMSPARRPTPARISNKAKHAVRYTAMIDQAIEEANRL